MRRTRVDVLGSAFANLVHAFTDMVEAADGLSAREQWVTCKRSFDDLNPLDKEKLLQFFYAMPADQQASIVHGLEGLEAMTADLNEELETLTKRAEENHR